MEQTYFACPFQFGLDADDALEAPTTVDAAAAAAAAAAPDVSAIDAHAHATSLSSALALENANDRMWLMRVYGVDSVSIDPDYLKLLNDLPVLNHCTAKFAKHLETRGSSRHYEINATVMNHSTSTKKAVARRNVAVNMSTIAGVVIAAGGSVYDSPVRYGAVNPNDRVLIRCKRNHHCMMWPEDITAWCTLCKCQDALDQTNTQPFSVLTNVFGSEMRLFRFKCASGHEFVTVVEDASGGCPSCRVERQLAAVLPHCNITVISPYEHKKTPLRLQCNGCRMQFYCSESGMKDPKVLSCDYTHAPVRTPERTIVLARHFLELIFRTRFDDIMSDEKVYFDGLSLRQGIAMLYEGNGITQKQISVAASWCHHAGAHLIVIPKKVGSNNIDIMLAVLRGLLENDMIVSTTEEILTELAEYLVSIYECLCRQHRPLFCDR